MQKLNNMDEIKITHPEGFISKTSVNELSIPEEHFRELKKMMLQDISVGELQELAFVAEEAFLSGNKLRAEILFKLHDKLSK